MNKVESQKQQKNEKQRQEQFATKIKQNDQIKTLYRKIDILKEGIFRQRDKQRMLKVELEKTKRTAAKIDDDNKRKYDQLTGQIKKLKDDLIQERYAKQNIYTALMMKQAQIKQKNPEEQKVGLGLFGFRSLFTNQ